MYDRFAYHPDQRKCIQSSWKDTMKLLQQLQNASNLYVSGSWLPCFQHAQAQPRPSARKSEAEQSEERKGQTYIPRTFDISLALDIKLEVTFDR
jgi:hypothetical protein